jgi:cytochrome c oxidase subunit 2
MVPESDLELGQLRLLEVDNRLVLPVNTHLRVIVTALGIKVDACPGRLNQVSTLIQRTGVYYGQCSELCGAYHAFMPIVIEATDLVSYLAWLKSQG